MLPTPERLRSVPLAVPKEHFLTGERRPKQVETSPGLLQAGAKLPNPGAREGRGMAAQRGHAPDLSSRPRPCSKSPARHWASPGHVEHGWYFSRESFVVYVRSAGGSAAFSRGVRREQDEGEVAPGRGRAQVAGLGLPRRKWPRRCPQRRRWWPMVPGGGAGAQLRSRWEWIVGGPRSLGRASIAAGLRSAGLAERPLGSEGLLRVRDLCDCRAWEGGAVCAAAEAVAAGAPAALRFAAAPRKHK